MRRTDGRRLVQRGRSSRALGAIRLDRRATARRRGLRNRRRPAGFSPGGKLITCESAGDRWRRGAWRGHVSSDESSAQQADYDADAHGAQPYPRTTTSAADELHDPLETLCLRDIVRYRMLDTRRRPRHSVKGFRRCSVRSLYVGQVQPAVATEVCLATVYCGAARTLHRQLDAANIAEVSSRWIAVAAR